MKNSDIKFMVFITIFASILLIGIVLVVKNQTSEKSEVARKEVDITGQPVLGDMDAPVTVVEFGDFKCPGCKKWGEIIFPQLTEDYVLSGNVKFAYVNVLLHDEESLLGAIAAESVYKQNPDIYWDFHKTLFKNQPREKDEEPWITIEKLLEIASEFPSISQEQLRKDLEEEVTIKQVNIDQDLYTKHNIYQTPTIIISGVIIEDPFDYEMIKEVIERELEADKNE